MAERNGLLDLALFIVVFWVIFPFPLGFLGYGNTKGILATDYMLDSSPLNNAIPDLGFITDLFKFIITLITGLINLVLFIVNFLLIYVKTLLLVYPDANVYLARFINLIQFLSVVFIAFFIRGNKG